MHSFGGGIHQIVEAVNEGAYTHLAAEEFVKRGVRVSIMREL